MWLDAGSVLRESSSLTAEFRSERSGTGNKRHSALNFLHSAKLRVVANTLQEDSGPWLPKKQRGLIAVICRSR